MTRRPIPPKPLSISQGVSDADIDAYGERCIEYGRRLERWEQGADGRDVVAALARAGLLDLDRLRALRSILPALEDFDPEAFVLDDEDDST